MQRLACHRLLTIGSCSTPGRCWGQNSFRDDNTMAIGSIGARTVPGSSILTFQLLNEAE